jgi:hypothetical protein
MKDPVLLCDEGFSKKYTTFVKVLEDVKQYGGSANSSLAITYRPNELLIIT